MRRNRQRVLKLEACVAKRDAAWLYGQYAQGIDAALAAHGIPAATRSRIVADWQQFWERTLAPLPLLMSWPLASETCTAIMTRLHVTVQTWWNTSEPLDPLWQTFVTNMRRIDAP